MDSSSKPKHCPSRRSIWFIWQLSSCVSENTSIFALFYCTSVFTIDCWIPKQSHFQQHTFRKKDVVRGIQLQKLMFRFFLSIKKEIIFYCLIVAELIMLVIAKKRSYALVLFIVSDIKGFDFCIYYVTTIDQYILLCVPSIKYKQNTCDL